MSKTQQVIPGTQDRLCQHYRSIGIAPKESARYASLVSKWLDKSGPVWTVKRLKALDQAFKRHLSKGPDVREYEVPEGWATRTSKRGRIIFDDGLVHEMFTDVHSPKNLKRALAFLRSYQVIQAIRPTRNMKEDFIKSVSTGFVDGGGDPLVLSSYERKVYEIAHGWKPITKDQRKKVLDKVSPLAYWPAQSEKSSPMFKMFLGPAGAGVVKVRSESRNNIETKQFIKMFWQDERWRKLWKEYPEKVSKSFTGVTTMPYIDYDGRMERNYSYFNEYLNGNQPLPAGTIGFIMEGGWKNRAVASPFLAIQSLAEELKQKLHMLSSLRPSIYTDDQSEAQCRISNWLSEDKTVYCFDGSAFTDRFPYSLQRRLMEGLLGSGWVNEFDIAVVDTVVESEFKLPGKYDEFVRYSVGQPMGLGPSFHLFCLTHCAIVESIAMEMGISNYEDHFCIVGDDIVISHPEIAESYQNTIERLGVKINLSKTIISPYYGEFCGKIISELGITPSMKVKPITNVDQLVRVLEFYGKEAHVHLTDRERGWFIKAFLPKELGGLAMTPHGMKYKEYLSYLDTTKIRDNLVAREVLDILKPVTSNTVERHMKWVSSFFEECCTQAGFNRQWLASLGVDSTLNELTGLPVSPSTTKHDVLRRRWLDRTVTRRQYTDKYTGETRDRTYKMLGNVVRDSRDLTSLMIDSTRSDIMSILERVEDKMDATKLSRHIVNLAIKNLILDRFGYFPTKILDSMRDHPLYAKEKDRQHVQIGSTSGDIATNKLNKVTDDNKLRSNVRQAEELKRARKFVKQEPDGREPPRTSGSKFFERLVRSASEEERRLRSTGKRRNPKEQERKFKAQKEKAKAAKPRKGPEGP